jgi:hypothetical protein
MKNFEKKHKETMPVKNTTYLKHHHHISKDQRMQFRKEQRRTTQKNIMKITVKTPNEMNF